MEDTIIKEQNVSEEAKIIIDIVLKSEDDYEAEEAITKRLKNLLRNRIWYRDI